MFGFMKGKMEIVIPKTTYTFGEVIEGKVTLELNKPQKAKGVTIDLVQEYTTHEYRGGKNVPTKHENHVGSIKLDEEKEYPAGQIMEYPFKFTLPTYKGPTVDPNSTLGKVVNVMQTMQPLINVLGSDRGGWFLKAKLDVSGFDVNKDVKLQVNVP